MCHIIDHANRTKFNDQLYAMFADRKRVFIDQLGWNLPVTGARFDIDEFDDGHAVYILALGKGGSHLGSIRLLRTDRPHILGSLFPQLCADGVPTGQDVREITRLCISPSVPRQHRRDVRNSLISAMVDHGLASGISALTGVVTARFLDQILAMGWRCDALGNRLEHCGTTLGAFCAHIDEATPQLLRQTGVYTAVLASDRCRRLYEPAILESA